jgi:hypothetical protein
LKFSILSVIAKQDVHTRGGTETAIKTRGSLYSKFRQSIRRKAPSKSQSQAKNGILPMHLKFECSSCGQHLSATRVQIGLTASCPNCNAAVTVPETSTLPHPTTTDKVPGKKGQRTTVILFQTGVDGQVKAKEVKKSMDDPAETRNWLIDRLSEIHAGKYLGGIFDQKTVEGMMPSRTESLAVEAMVPSRTERLTFWRDEYALDSFTALQQLLAFMLSQSQQGPQMRTWLAVSATVLYARPFKQLPEVRLAVDDVPIKCREVHNEVLKYRDKVIAHLNPDAHKRDVWENELPIVSDGSNIRIPTTNPAMENDIAGSLLELVEILIPVLRARSSSFVSKYLPRPLAPGAYVLSLEENPAEWLTPATPT